MGKRKRDRQPAMWVTTTDLPTAASHPFYRRLNQLLREHGFDDFVEAQCAGFYAGTMGRIWVKSQPGVARRSRSPCRSRADRPHTAGMPFALRILAICPAWSFQWKSNMAPM